MRTTSFQFITLTVGLSLIGCSGTDSGTPVGGGGAQGVGGSTGVGGNTGTAGGSPAVGGSAQVGGGVSTGGAATGGAMAATGGNIPGTGGATGGSPQTGGNKATGGAATGGMPAAGGAATGGMPAAGGAATGGKAATGGAAAGGAATGGKAATGGAAAGGAATGGKAATGGAAAGGGAAGGAAGGGPDCSATMPTGGVDHTGTNINGTADGLNYGIWTNGSGGTITVFSNAHAFAATWNNSQDFLAHLGLDFNASKAATAYTSIIAQFSETKSGTAGGFSMIGIYGWMHSPCVEWYINEDSWNGLAPRGSTTVTIDGATYYLSTSQTTGTGGANACESGHTGAWTNMTSTRASAHTCGTVTVSDHFKAWAAAGWSLGSLASVHINVEVGGGQGSIQFPVANVTAN